MSEVGAGDRSAKIRIPKIQWMRAARAQAGNAAVGAFFPKIQYSCEGASASGGRRRIADGGWGGN